MKFLLYSILFVFVPFHIFSQNNLSLDDYMSGKYRVNRPEYFQWIPNSRSFSYVLENTLYIRNADSTRSFPVLQNDSISNQLGSFNTRFPEYTWIDSSTLIFQIDSSIVLYSKTLHKSLKKYRLPSKAENIDIDNSLNVAYTVGNNLYYLDTAGKQNQITNNISSVSSGGKYVYREEFGTSKSTFWSPDGDALAYYSNNELKIPSYPRLDYSNEFVKENTLKYPFVGASNQLVSLYVYNIKTKKRVRLNTGEIDHYITNATWSPDGQYIYLFDLSRNQSECTLRRYNVKTGNLDRNYFTEKSPKYVEPLHPVYFINHSSQFVYLSRKSGFNQIYYCPNDSSNSKAITKSTMEVNEVLGIENQFVYYSAIDQLRPMEEHLYKTNFTNGVTLQISTEAGIHTGLINEMNGLIIDGYSNNSTVLAVDICDLKKKMRSTIFTAQSPFSNISYPTTDFVTLKAADDSTILYGCTIKPQHFDSTKKYPVIIYVYGGPHIQLVKNDFLSGVGLIPYFLASKGFVVFSVDSRGSANRGLQFESCTFHKLGTIETADQLKGVEFIKNQPNIDTNRIGVYGESFGGFMTLTLMEQASNIFKVGVSCSPVTDWKYYEIMYGERYMGTPQSNPLGYLNASTINKVSLIKGKLLLINGGVDHITVANNSMAFLNECIKNNIQIDYFLYPNHDHHVLGKDRLHFMTKLLNYFTNNL